MILPHLARHPASQMFENPANGLGNIDQCDYVRRHAASWTFKRIDFIDFGMSRGHAERARAVTT